MERVLESRAQGGMPGEGRRWKGTAMWSAVAGDEDANRVWKNKLAIAIGFIRVYPVNLRDLRAQWRIWV